MINPNMAEENPPYSQLAKVVKEARKDRKLSQREFSRTLGMSNAYISHLEGGKIQPSVKTLRNISSALEISYNSLAILAKYVDPSIFDQTSNSEKSLRVKAISDLTEREWDSVLDYVNYIRSQRNK
ncbi:MAG: helix-turn-helix transcriptional regulator [Chloroflexota bacterium]|nr:helix-turn-helix transcriptional regulator [Chloroflexota bacterium]